MNIKDFQGHLTDFRHSEHTCFSTLHNVKQEEIHKL